MSPGHTSSLARIDPEQPVRIGRWTARFGRGGLYLDFDRVPLVRGGIVQVFSADSRTGYYGSGSQPPSVQTETLPDGGRAYAATYRYAGNGAAFQALQRIEIHPDNTARLTLLSRWDGQSRAHLEWNAARLWAYTLLGAAYEGTPAGGGPKAVAMRGRIPLLPRPDPAPPRRVLDGWSCLTLRLPAVGDLTLTSSSNGSTPDAADLLDGRNDSNLQDDRVFWLGFASAALEPGKERLHTLLLSLTPRSVTAPPQYEAGRLEARPATVKPIPDAALPAPQPSDAAGRPILVPQPKRVEFTRSDLELQGRLPLTIALPSDNAGRRAARAARQFAAEISNSTGVQWTERHIGNARQWSPYGLLVTALGSGVESKSLKPVRLLQPEGYSLIVTARFAAIVGRNAAGAYYGLQTLRQLLRIGSTGSERKTHARFVGVRISDWPSLRMRAAHLFVGKDALPFHRKLIDRILSRYKLNTLLIECEYTRWRSHPEIWTRFSMNPGDLRTEVAFARDHFMEPIPLINSLGHSEWMFENRQHIDLAEDVASPHAYDAANPESYRFLFGVFDEALDIFHPRFFHIGHDEVTLLGSDQFGRYPARPANVNRGATALFTEDTARLATWLRRRGATTMLWGDMLLHASEGDSTRWPELVASNAPTAAEAQERRDLLPRDAVIADWRYDPGSEQRNALEIFQKGGHPALGAAWYMPENIRGWALQAIANRAIGTIQTTWAGYDSRESLLEDEYRQFTAFVLAAEYAWSGTQLHPRPETPEPLSPAPNLLPYSASDIFASAYRDLPTTSPSRTGWYLDLRGAANVSLVDSADSTGFVSHYSATPDHTPPPSARAARPASSSVEPGATAIGMRVHFAGSHYGGILLRGLLGPERSTIGKAVPGSIALLVGAKARELLFVHATLCGFETGLPVAAYVLDYADGQSVEVPLRYGREIRALDDESPERSLTAVRLLVPRSGFALHALRWRNPHPNLTIKRIRFRSVSPLASPVLFAITGLR